MMRLVGMWAARGLGARFPRLSAALMVVLVLTLCCGGGCSGTANRGQQQKTTADAESLRATRFVTSVTDKMVIKPQFEYLITGLLPADPIFRTCTKSRVLA